MSGHHDVGAGHVHHHGHGHGVSLDVGAMRVEIESHAHGQASTVSATLMCRERTCGATFADLAGSLAGIASSIEAAGGIVGHVKAFAKTDGFFAHASCTDGEHAPAVEGDVGMLLGKADAIQLAAIAMLTDLDDLERIVVDCIAGFFHASSSRLL